MIKSAYGFSGYEPYTADINTGVDTNYIVPISTLSYLAKEEWQHRSTGGNWANGTVFTNSYAVIKRLERVRGKVRYELKNFRGDIRQVISDVKYREEVNGVVEYTADVWQVEDSYPFGWSIKERSFSVDQYRFGFNGMEKNPEHEGSYTTEYRQLDTRIGRWLSTDPVVHPWQSPYSLTDNSSIWKNDPDGKSGRVKIRKRAKKVIVRSRMIFYGTKASKKTAKESAKDAQALWNAANGTVIIDGNQYDVEFKIKGRVNRSIRQKRIENNKSIVNNFFRVEDNTSQGVSYVDGLGANTGVWKLSNIENTGSTTEAHEMGHGYGLDHPKSNIIIQHGKDNYSLGYDARNELEGISVMAPRGSLVNPEYQYDSNAKVEYITTVGKGQYKGFRIVQPERGATVNPKKRIVTQADVDNLGLNKLEYKKGKANLGKKTNIYHEKGN